MAVPNTHYGAEGIAKILSDSPKRIFFCGIGIGKTAGTKLANKAGILGGVILIFIGIEIFLSNIF